MIAHAFNYRLDIQAIKAYEYVPDECSQLALLAVCNKHMSVCAIFFPNRDPSQQDRSSFQQNRKDERVIKLDALPMIVLHHSPLSLATPAPAAPMQGKLSQSTGQRSSHR